MYATVQDEAAHYKRELLEERSKSKALQVAEKSSKAAAERAEGELRSLRERTAEQLSDANANKGELWKQMMQTKDLADKERKGLADKLTDAQSALEAANARCDHGQGLSSMLEVEKDKMKHKVLAARVD